MLGKNPCICPTSKVSVIDTVGASDTYTADLMLGPLQQGLENAAQLKTHSDETWFELMDFAAAASAIN